MPNLRFLNEPNVLTQLANTSHLGFSKAFLHSVLVFWIHQQEENVRGEGL